ncbi:hypothetical protein BGX28_004274 [Mortierella sp. GBA30]|nr:hypothetical protein BGX28_004274 [Mortierella sp. GBA30]
MEKIVYKVRDHPGHHMPDLFVLTEPGMAQKYRAQKLPQGPIGNLARRTKENEAPVGLVDVVQSFDVFQTESGKGFEGRVARPAKADLEAIFHTEDQQEIVEKIVLEGEIQGARV